MITPFQQQRNSSKHSVRQCLQRPRKKIKHIKAIQDLSAILVGARDSSTMRTSTHPATTQPLTAQRVAAPSTRVVNAPPPRMATTSNNITAPNVIRTMPLVHQRHTCNNNPFHILSDDDDDDDTVVASNCSPRDPLPTLPSSDLLASQPTNRPTRQLVNQPRSPPSTSPKTVSHAQPPVAGK
jgi:hypothetical protein